MIFASRRLLVHINVKNIVKIACRTLKTASFGKSLKICLTFGNYFDRIAFAIIVVNYCKT